jgi:SP family arabinose:H+ symporter-like MFS transporter
VFMSEVFPTRIRGRAMSIATLCLWLTNAVVCQTFPVLRDSPSVGPAPTFWLYALLVTPVFVFVWKFMPETKGRSLEELEKAFAENRA